MTIQFLLIAKYWRSSLIDFKQHLDTILVNVFVLSTDVKRILSDYVCEDPRVVDIILRNDWTTLCPNGAVIYLECAEYNRYNLHSLNHDWFIRLFHEFKHVRAEHSEHPEQMYISYSCDPGELKDFELWRALLLLPQASQNHDLAHPCGITELRRLFYAEISGLPP